MMNIFSTQPVPPNCCKKKNQVLSKKYKVPNTATKIDEFKNTSIDKQ